MRKFGLTKKILLVIFCMFTVVFSIIYIGMARYFETFFAKKEIAKIENKVREYFDEKDMKTDFNELELKRIVDEYSKKNTNPILIVKGGVEISPKRRYIVYLESEERVIPVEVGEAVFQLQNQGINLKKGMDISFFGFWSDELFIGLSIYDVTQNNLSGTYDKYKEKKDFVRISGRVIDYDLPQYEKGSIYKQDKIYEIIKSNIWKDKVNFGKTVTVERIDVVTNIKNFFIIIPYKDFYIFTVYSLQPVKEVIKAIPEFLKLIILFTMILSGVFIVIVVKIILKPVLKINEVALKISNLDFSDRITVNTSDEINMISKSINTMADRLENALKQLEERNRVLKDELIKKEIFEESRKRFVADVSHELKTPLSIVRAYTERLEDKHVSDEKGLRCIYIIKDENKKMNKLINDLLELSKLESKQDILNKERYNISIEISEIVERFSQVFKEQGLDLVLNIEEDLSVFADVDRMNQVFNNMISNALKYAPRESQVSIGLMKLKNGTRFYISNILVDKKKLEISRVWDRFYKADKARSRKLGGTGLGLAISKRIIQLHGFTFEVDVTGDIIKFIVDMEDESPLK